MSELLQKKTLVSGKNSKLTYKKIKNKSLFTESTNAKRNDYSHNFDFKRKDDNKSFVTTDFKIDQNTDTYELMQNNKSSFVASHKGDQTVYLEPDFEQYQMYQKKPNKSLYKTHDGMHSRDKLPRKESKNRLMQYRQSSTKNLNQTMNRVQSKRLTQRGKKLLNKLNASAESFKNLDALRQQFMIDASSSQLSPSRRYKGSKERSSDGMKPTFIPVKISSKKDPQPATDATYTKSYAAQKKSRL